VVARGDSLITDFGCRWPARVETIRVQTINVKFVIGQQRLDLTPFLPVANGSFKASGIGNLERWNTTGVSQFFSVFSAQSAGFS
jgi:hypothetical protein